MKKRTARDCLCLALDGIDRDEILRLTDLLRDDVGCFKINAAFVRYGPELVRQLQERSVSVFLDLKFHDIPATVAAHVRAAADMGVDWLTVHAGGGFAMLRAAAEAARADATASRRPRVLAVTVLTSLDRQAMNDELRVSGAVEDQVGHLADAAVASGMDGIVCSASDLMMLHERLPEYFLKVTPGIGGLNTAAGIDQKRVSDPVAAIWAGSSMLVIGRAILEAPDPVVAARAIGQALAGVLQQKA